MLRKLIASLIALYAIAFAFGALTAVRWPSIMMVVSWMVQDDIASGLDAVDWRALGIAYGAPYLLAALSFYCSSIMISGRRPGGVLWYVTGLCAGFPPVYLVSFESGWWRDPSIAEGAVAGAIPIIRNLEEYYNNDSLTSVEGIVNGTTNYILTQSNSGIGYDEAL